MLPQTNHSSGAQAYESIACNIYVGDGLSALGQGAATRAKERHARVQCTLPPV